MGRRNYQTVYAVILAVLLAIGAAYFCEFAIR